MPKITERELEVLRLFIYNNVQIANILCLSKGTVKTHVSKILHKLKSRNKTEALVIAIKSGLINPYHIKTKYVDMGFWDSNGKYEIDMQEVENES